MESGQIHNLLAFLVTQSHLLQTQNRILEVPHQGSHHTNSQANPTKKERFGQNQISSSIPGIRPIDVFLSINSTDWKNTKLIVQILVVHVSMFILSLQCTDFNFSHGTKLLQGSSKASLLKTHPNGLKRQPLSRNGTVNTP